LGAARLLAGAIRARAHFAWHLADDGHDSLKSYVSI
jgi:hypothetical protein